MRGPPRPLADRQYARAAVLRSSQGSSRTALAAAVQEQARNKRKGIILSYWVFKEKNIYSHSTEVYKFLNRLMDQYPVLLLYHTARGVSRVVPRASCREHRARVYLTWVFKKIIRVQFQIDRSVSLPHCSSCVVPRVALSCLVQGASSWPSSRSFTPSYSAKAASRPRNSPVTWTVRLSTRILG